jgi:hypothetical protein
VRRVAITLGIVALLASSCGQDAYPAALANTLQDRVVRIRDMAESGQPGRAIALARDLIELVTARMEAGRLDGGKALEIIAAADLVVERLALVPRPSPTETPSPTPVDEDEGKPGKGEGHGDDGHGNDENGGHGNDD